MIYVQMTRDIKERQPKLFGVVTLKQAIGIAVSAVLAALIMILFPVQFVYRVLIAMVPALPILVIAFYPKNETSPVLIAKYYLNRMICGPDVYIHDGDSDYYKEKTGTSKPKIKRYRDYEGIR